MDEGELLSLIRRVAAGDREAQQRLVRDYEAWMRERIRKRLGPQLRLRLDTEDVLQSSMALALRDLRGKGADFAGERPFLAWLLKLTQRKIQMAARRHGAEKRDVGRQVRLTTPDRKGARQTSPSQAAARSEEAEAVRAVLAELPDLDRRVIELRVIEGLGFKAIAAQLEQPSEAAVRQRYVRLLSRIGPEMRRSCPASRICPASGECTPVKSLIRVLLPAPFSPTNACTSPGRTSKSTPSRARTPGKLLFIPRMRSQGAGVGGRSALTERRPPSTRARHPTTPPGAQSRASTRPCGPVRSGLGCSDRV